MTVRLTVLGDALLDRDVDGAVHRLAPDAPVPVVDQEHVTVRAGGAGLAATLAAAGGHDVRLVTALAGDAAGAELSATLADAGVEVCALELGGATPEKIRVRAQRRALLRLDRGGSGGRVGPATAAARAAIEWADAVLVADYGRGVAADDGLRAALRRALARGVPVVWDPHPRGPAPVAEVTLATPNAGEAATFAARAAGAAAGVATVGDTPAGAVAATVAHAETLRGAWGAHWLCVTRGAGGAVLAGPDGLPRTIAATPVAVGDPCGAGDRFAARAAELLGGGADVPGAVAAAVRAASAFVAAGGASAAGATAAEVAPAAMDTADAVLARVRAQGGTVVATGGCFDLLHPGHVHTLQAARALGDCLVVCLNSDASVRRLKGPQRPVVAQDDRAAVLNALGCVDAVTIFDEDTPAAILDRLRPDLWVKGGDYAAADLPEAAALAARGGRAVVLPFIEGRSTTRLIEEAALHAV
ncbi:MAG: D-beta-D-heptose 7-phosphate kinase / D-beta-D-heptose 1-phosphate adenosyltransferase [Baekduia sp.]|nr:D-beta-D-heptose 7-phosphate kinase / D-beta-D-heptose 1-phosphate adenosyltransferase [Baekduia sp.]